jgi:hypothetical protein
MKKSLAVAAVLMVLIVGAFPADAAAPAGGTLSKTKQSLSWTGASYNYAIPWPDPILFCTDAQCDHFKLKVNMGDGARVKVSIKASSSGLEVAQVVAGPNDYDLYLYDPNGNQIADSADSDGNESFTFTHKARFRNKTYDVMVSPWIVLPGATYKGTITTVKFVK